MKFIFNGESWDTEKRIFIAGTSSKWDEWAACSAERFYFNGESINKYGCKCKAAVVVELHFNKGKGERFVSEMVLRKVEDLDMPYTYHKFFNRDKFVNRDKLFIGHTAKEAKEKVHTYLMKERER